MHRDTGDPACRASIRPRRPARLVRLAWLLAGYPLALALAVSPALVPVSAQPAPVAVAQVGGAASPPPDAASGDRRTADLLDRPARVAPVATRSLLLDVERAGQRLVAVGERGHVLLSDDDGRSWRQARLVPSRTMLTAVAFADERRGWAVGHDELILHTRDGGETWSRQHWAPESQQPLLDVWFADAARGFAVGAYQTLLATTDGGASWTRRPFEPAPLPRSGPPDPDQEFAPEYHLNAIAGQGSRLWIAAEAGQLYRSDDGGASWRSLPSPYGGSFFGLLPLSAEAVLAFGLRGNLYRSDDGGEAWRKLETGTTAMLTDGVALGGGRLAIVGLSGTVLLSADAGETWRLRQQPDRRGLGAALLAADGALVAVGEEGVRRIALDGESAGGAPGGAR
ncbi:MAG: YCF48-related protein [Steroidobacteraceae bacterium]|jgi:photosystem II stability/assembly factor-like uncharacterized protein|nr:YCF48-related protein [Steroidobacteraceae bacterium]